MMLRLLILLIATFATTACTRSLDSRHAKDLSEDQRAAVAANVSTFMQAVAHDVTEQGPMAWQKHFIDDPAFFMANDGRLVFPNTQAAAQGIQAFARTIQHIELHWGADLRVDVLTANFAIVATSWSEIQIDTAGHRVNENGFFTGLLEDRGGRWQFRDAHWSSIPPAKTP
jgi:hypothetical protein